MTELAVRALEPESIAAAAAVLARSHRDDPAFAHVLGDRGRRVGVLAGIFGQWLGHAFSAGAVDGVFRRERLIGVAAWLAPPGDTQAPAAFVRTAAPYLPLAIARPRAAVRLLCYMTAAAASHPSVPRWYLEVVGIDDGERGRGAGRLLLTPGLARADEQRTPCYLETCERRNAAFYESLGFVVERSGLRLVTGGHAPTHWTMWRDPR